MSYKEKDEVREAKIKAARFCAYRERAPLEVLQKLRGYGLISGDVEQVLEKLIRDGFLNENRFAISYANGKLRQKKWGKIKIRRGLEQYKIESNCIDVVLEAIPNDEYQDKLKKLLDKKWLSLKISDPFIRKHKVAQFVISKGFEPSLIWEYLKDGRFTIP
jgi:regulatory protein